MSYLSPPQIFFKGRFSSNVATGNNAGTLNIFEGDQEVGHEVAVFDMVRAQMVEPEIIYQGKPLTDTQIRQLMFMGRGDRGPNFNYMEGGNVCGFQQVQVTGVAVGGTDSGELVGQSVSFSKGSMVDLNPLGGNIATQIFGDVLTVGDATQSMSGTLQTSFSRIIWWNRLTTGADSPNDNPADDGGGGDHKGSAVFQSMIAKESIKFSGNLTGALAELKSVLQADEIAGLNVRYTLYQSSVEFQGKNMTSMSTVVGVIGLQRADQVTTEPPGRYLISPQYSTNPTADNNKLLGALYAEVNIDQVRLDVITAIPEQNSQGEKENLGPLKLILEDGDQQWTVAELVPGPASGQAGDVPVLSYGQAQYDASGGTLGAVSAGKI